MAPEREGGAGGVAEEEDAPEGERGGAGHLATGGVVDCAVGTKRTQQNARLPQATTC